MIYRKPKDVTYVDMAIYIDNHFYKGDYDVDLLYQYLYHISKHLAREAQYFETAYDYDNFALYAATILYTRLSSPKRLVENSKYEKIKSILNYAKKTLYPMKVDFLKLHYNQIISEESVEDEVNYNFDNLLSKHLASIDMTEFDLLLGDIGKTCENYLSTLPYDKSSSEWLNIYTSVMLTTLSSITLRNQSIRKIEHLTETEGLKDYHYNDMYEQESDEVILFHLPETMRMYILVLSREIKSIIAKDLCGILHTKVHTDFMLAENQKKTYFFNKDLSDESKNRTE